MLDATVAAGSVTLGATVRQPDGRVAYVTPVRFSAAAFGVPDVQSCAAGLAGARASSEGIRLTLPTRGGALCDGQPFEPVLSVDAPSRVHVYDVAADGTAYHIWPEPGGDGSVTGTVSLGISFATPPIAPGDEMLVAVAVPLASAPTALDGATGFCRMPGKFSLSDLPGAVLVSTVSCHIDSRARVCGPAPSSQSFPVQLQARICGRSHLTLRRPLASS